MNERLSRIGNIRALAIFLVVLGHSIILYSSRWDLYETSRDVPFLNWLKYFIDIPQMPLFFSLSGYLFVFTHSKKRGFVHLLRNKALRLLVPYLGIGLCFLFPIRVAIGFHSYQGMGIGAFFLKLQTANDVGHLWFLPALFFVFLLSEIILTIAEKIPRIRKCPALFLCLAALALYLEGYRIGLGYPPLLSAFNYLIWFSLGYFLNMHQYIVRRVYHISSVKWALLMLNAGLLIYCLFADSVRALLSLGLKTLCILNAYGAMPEKSCALTEQIDRNSFGVYLFHSPLIYITFATIPNAHPAIVVFVNLVVFGAVAYGLTALIRKTKLKVLIGE